MDTIVMVQKVILSNKQIDTETGERKKPNALMLRY
jgi:hypothetical protein